MSSAFLTHIEKCLQLLENIKRTVAVEWVRLCHESKAGKKLQLAAALDLSAQRIHLPFLAHNHYLCHLVLPKDLQGRSRCLIKRERERWEQLTWSSNLACPVMGVAAKLEREGGGVSSKQCKGSLAALVNGWLCTK